MSTQSPTPPTPKGPRSNNRRNPKKNTTPHNTQKVAPLTTPPSSPPRNMSPATDSSNNLNLSKKKNPRSGKKPREVSRASPAYNAGHQHTSSNPNAATPHLKDSPHYAGPTFHASPAPSALPMPSFFSKSMPDSDLAPAVETDSDVLETEPEPDFETTPSKPKSRSHYSDDEQKPSPLDFLFKAAVQARNSSNPCRSPEAAAPRARSPQTDSKALPQRKSNGVAGGMFPLEMENSDGYHIGPSFAPSYKDRMNALRSASSPSRPTIDEDEDRRRAKTQALKDLLLNPRPQRPSSASPLASNFASGYGGSPSPSPGVPHYATPLRTTSGPPATPSHSLPHQQSQSSVGNGAPRSTPFARMASPQRPRTEQSALRKEVPSSSPGPNAGAAVDKFSSPYASYNNQHNFTNGYTQQPSYGSPMPQVPAPPRAIPGADPSAQALDTKKMEDDLRRILKLDVNSSIPSSGVQSSFA